jgi:hypothetical protein
MTIQCVPSFSATSVLTISAQGMLIGVVGSLSRAKTPRNVCFKIGSFRQIKLSCDEFIFVRLRRIVGESLSIFVDHQQIVVLGVDDNFDAADR